MYGLYQIGGVTVPSFTIITLSFEGYVYVTHNWDRGGGAISEVTGGPVIHLRNRGSMNMVKYLES